MDIHNTHARRAPSGRRVRLIAIGAALAATSAGLAACGGGSSGASDSKEIIIGVPAALTGPGAAYGKPQADAVQMVADAINASGGIKELDGAKIKVLIQDTKSDPNTAAKVIREMSREGVSAFIGPNSSGEVIAAKPLIQSLKIPDFTGTVDPSITEDNEGGYIFRTEVNSKVAAEATVAYIGDLVSSGTLKDVTKVGIVETTTPPGPAEIPLFEQGLEALGIETTLIEYDPTQVKDFAPFVAKLREADVDLITGHQAPNDATLFAQAIADQSWRPQGGFVFTGSPQFLDSFRESLGDNVTGWVTTAYASTLDNDYYSQETRDLAAEFEEKYGASMLGTSATVGATNMAVIANAIAAAESKDPEDIAKAAREMTFENAQDFTYPYYMTVGGLDFDENQDNSALVVPFVQVNAEGGLNTVAPEEVADAPYEPIR